MLRRLSKPIRTVFRWQLAATALCALVAGLVTGAHGGPEPGAHGALSAALGGLVSMAAGIAAAVVASLGRAQSAGGALLAVIRAETVKVGLIVLLLWLVLVNYRDMVALAFFGTFFLTVLVFSMAFFVREH